MASVDSILSWEAHSKLGSTAKYLYPVFDSYESKLGVSDLSAIWKLAQLERPPIYFHLAGWYVDGETHFCFQAGNYKFAVVFDIKPANMYCKYLHNPEAVWLQVAQKIQAELKELVIARSMSRSMSKKSQALLDNALQASFDKHRR